MNIFFFVYSLALVAESSALHVAEIMSNYYEQHLDPMRSLTHERSTTRSYSIWSLGRIESLCAMPTAD